MKKKIVTIALLLLMFIPFQVKAAEQSMNLEETLKDANLTADLSNYKENDNQAIIYLFRGSTCGYCHSFLEYLVSILPEYGQYFKLVSYEVWGNSDNSKLMKNVGDFLGESVSGVPYIVIGDKTFVGYASSYNEQIKSAIMEQYNSKNSYDVMKEMKKEEKKSSGGSAVSIIWNLVFVAVGTGVIILYEDSKHKNLLKQMNELKEMLGKTTKENGEVKNNKNKKGNKK